MKNALEELVLEVYAQLRTKHTEFCSCERCHDDVIAQALNKARPRYIGGSPIGAAVTRVSLASDQDTAQAGRLLDLVIRGVASGRGDPGRRRTLRS